MSDEPKVENRNPLAPPTADMAKYEKLGDGRWVATLSSHPTMQTQFVGESKEECQKKMNDHLKSLQ